MSKGRYDLIRFSSLAWKCFGHTIARCCSIEEAEAIALAALNDGENGWIDLYDIEAPWNGEPIKTWSRYLD